MTAPSPPTSGSVATRTSMRRPSTFSAVRPSCGMRRSAMSSSDMILMREMTPATRRRGMRVASAQHAVDAEADDAARRATGSKWMSEAPWSTPWATSELTSLTTGASSADSRRSTTSGALVGDGLLDDHVVDLVHAPDERADVLLRGDGGADRRSRHQRDVVDREHVARVDHRDEQRALVEEADGDGRVALRGRGGQQVRGGHVDAEGVEVDVVDAEALGDDPRELVRRQDAAVDEHLARAPAAGPRLGDRELDGLRVRRSRSRRRCRRSAATSGRARTAG